MNYLDKIKNAMKPQLHEVTVNDITFWVHRPSMQDFPKCDSLVSTLILCVKDENGDPIFADKDIDGRVNANSMDFAFAQDLYKQVIALLDTNTVDEVEKK